MLQLKLFSETKFRGLLMTNLMRDNRCLDGEMKEAYRSPSVLRSH